MPPHFFTHVRGSHMCTAFPWQVHPDKNPGNKEWATEMTKDANGAFSCFKAWWEVGDESNVERAERFDEEGEFTHGFDEDDTEGFRDGFGMDEEEGFFEFMEFMRSGMMGMGGMGGSFHRVPSGGGMGFCHVSEAVEVDREGRFRGQGGFRGQQAGQQMGQQGSSYARNGGSASEDEYGSASDCDTDDDMPSLTEDPLAEIEELLQQCEQEYKECRDPDRRKELKEEFHELEEAREKVYQEQEMEYHHHQQQQQQQFHQQQRNSTNGLNQHEPPPISAKKKAEDAEKVRWEDAMEKFQPKLEKVSPPPCSHMCVRHACVPNTPIANRLRSREVSAILLRSMSTAFVTPPLPFVHTCVWVPLLDCFCSLMCEARRSPFVHTCVPPCVLTCVSPFVHTCVCPPLFTRLCATLCSHMCAPPSRRLRMGRSARSASAARCGRI